MLQQTPESYLEWVVGLQRGDRRSFELIYHHFSGELFSFARKNTLSKEDAEEIIQDVFISLWQRRENLQIQSLRHYLFNAVRYKVLRYFNHDRVKRKYAEHYRIFETIYDSVNDVERDPELLRQKIEECINKLPARCRMVIRLRLTESLSNSEIALRMNITKKTVEQNMVKAFIHIRSFEKEILQSS